jgi:hypothetical protein
MPQIKDLGKGGLNLDTSPVILPPNVFTDGLNIRFRDDSVEMITGEALGRVLPIAADFGIHWRRPDQGYNLFAKDGNVVKVDASGSTSSMFSSTDSKYANSDWQATHFNGGYAVIFNNGKSTPLYCLYGDAVSSTTLQPLPNWNYTAGLTVTAKVIRSLNYSLVAANLTIADSGLGTTSYAPSTIRVSTQAPTGGIPQTWKPGLTTDTADEFEVSSTSPILDMAELRGNLFIYSQDSVSYLTIGSQTVLRPYSKTHGIMNTDCVVEFDGKHFVVDNNDIYVHNGSGLPESILNKRLKKYFFSNLNKSATEKVVVTRDRYHKEIWVSYPKGTATICTEALIYNYVDNTWTKRTLPNLTYSFAGPLTESNSFKYAREVINITTNTTQTLITDDNYVMYNGTALVNIFSFLEKKKINSGDITQNVLLDTIHPCFDIVPTNSSIMFTIVGQNAYAKDISLTEGVNPLNIFEFTPNVNTSKGYKVDPRENGRFINMRISSSGYWRLPLFSVEFKPADRR